MNPSIQNLSLPAQTIQTARSRTSQKTAASKNSCDINVDSVDENEKDSEVPSSKKYPNNTPLLHDKAKKKVRAGSKKRKSSQSKKRANESSLSPFKNQTFKLSSRGFGPDANLKTERKSPFANKRSSILGINPYEALPQSQRTSVKEMEASEMIFNIKTP